MSMYERFQKLRVEFKGYFKEREEVVDGVLIALLSKQHLLLIGPPGTAKTSLAESLCKSITGAKYFFHLLTKFTTDKDLLVSEVIVEEEIEQKGKLIKFINRSREKFPQAHIAFLDEIFKCNAVTLNALLRIIHERKCAINPGEEINVPLITLIGASNELPGKDQEELIALNDRFLLRYVVDYLSVNNNEDSSFVSMISNESAGPQATITIEELHGFQEDAAKIKVPNSIYRVINNIRSELKITYNIQPSDRRYKESIKVVKAFAYMNQHFDEVEPEDLAILEHIYWQNKDPLEKENIQKVIYKLIGSKEVIRIAEIYQNARKLYSEGIRIFETANQKNLVNEKERKEFELLRKRVVEIKQEFTLILKEPKELLKSCENSAGKAIIENYIHKIEMIPQKLTSKEKIFDLRQFWGKEMDN